MIKQIAFWILVLFLGLSGIGTALNQELLTEHMVEIGMSKWQFSRTLVFIYAGFSIISAIIIGFKMNWMPGIMLIVFMLLVVFGMDQLYTFKSANTTPTCSWFLPWIDITSRTAAAISMLVFAIVALSAGIVWGTQVVYRKVPVFVYLALAPLFMLSFASQPLYPIDFQSTQSEVPEGFTVERLETMFDDEAPDEYAAIVVSVSCQACIDLSKRLAITIKNHRHIPVYIVTKTTGENLDIFMNTVDLDSSQVHLININNELLFREFVGDGYPHAYIIKDHKIDDHRTQLLCNMNYLDKIIR